MTYAVRAKRQDDDEKVQESYQEHDSRLNTILKRTKAVCNEPRASVNTYRTMDWSG
jgi:hypothetical protein